jgi:hypothetical protein
MKFRRRKFMLASLSGLGHQLSINYSIYVRAGRPVRFLSAAIGISANYRRGSNGCTRFAQKSGLSARGTAASFPEYQWIFSAQTASAQSPRLRP